MATTAHLTSAEDLREDDRILLKDLRILTMTSRPQHTAEDEVTIKYYQLAIKENGKMVVSANQKVKVLCPDRCPICLTLDDLI